MKQSVLTSFLILLMSACSPSSDNRNAPLPVQENATTKFTNDAYGQFASIKNPANSADYFARRSLASQLAYAGDWAAARPVLDKLVSEYTDDGDIWYLLGLSCFNTEDWACAITAFKRTIELGTALKGVPTGSSPSNDIMIRIAEAYAELGDVKNAKTWAEKALTARYDERPFLAGRAPFEKAFSSEEFQKLNGDYVDGDLSRDALWRADLRALVSELRRLHVNLHHHMPAQAFQDRIEAIDTAIPTLTDPEIVFEFMTLVGGLGNGHNLIVPTNGAKGSFSRLPVEFYWFSNGLFIVNANETFEHLIGLEVKAVGGVPATDALNKTIILNARDNEMQHLWLAPYYVSLPEVLKGLDVIDDVNETTLTLAGVDGGMQDVTLTGGDWTFMGFPKLPKLKNTVQPQYLEKSDELFWMEIMPEYEAVFVQINWVAEREDKTLAAFSRELSAEIKNNDIQNLILDLRHNPGGDGSLLPPLLRSLIHFEVANPDGKLFVITGRGTYSAAHELLTRLNGLTGAIIVGEPSGSRPNAVGEAGWFKLPHSQLRGLASSQFHQGSSAEDHRIWIAPHVPTSLSSGDYFAGKDPALEAVFAVITQNSKRSEANPG